MSFIIVVLCLALLIVLISYFKVDAFIAFLISSILAGIALGIPLEKLPDSVNNGIGSILGGLTLIIVLGAMLGKLVAESGAAQKIASVMVSLFGTKHIQWGLMVTGFVVGIPLFYGIGFVLLVPLIFSIVYKYKLPAVYIGLPMLAALSVTHGFLPPHPSPVALVVQLFFIGFLGEYIMSINQRVMKRPLVIEEERLNFDQKDENAKDGKANEV